MATLPESRRTAFPVELSGVLPVIASAQKPEHRPGAEISRAGMGREAHALAARQNGPKRERRPVRSAGGNAPVFDRRGGSVRPECCKPATRGLGCRNIGFRTLETALKAIRGKGAPACAGVGRCSVPGLSTAHVVAPDRQIKFAAVAKF